MDGHHEGNEQESEMIVGIIVTIGIVAFFGYCIIVSSDDLSDEEQKREDEEQAEYLRKWRENGNHKT